MMYRLSHFGFAVWTRIIGPVRCIGVAGDNGVSKLCDRGEHSLCTDAACECFCHGITRREPWR